MNDEEFGWNVIVFIIRLHCFIRTTATTKKIQEQLESFLKLKMYQINYIMQ